MSLASTRIVPLGSGVAALAALTAALLQPMYAEPPTARPACARRMGVSPARDKPNASREARIQVKSACLAFKL